MAKSSSKSSKKLRYTKAWYALAFTRMLMSFVFLWAFVDKTFGLGMATKPDAAWIAGGSPTNGFLTFGVNEHSPLASFFNGLAGQAWVDWLFMLGLLGIGLALLLGIGLRLAAVAGVIMMVLMWLALLPLDNNPVIDDHIVYAAILVVFAVSRREWSLTDWWLSKPFVKKNSWLW